ncbi:cytochrome P450 [Burkholderia stagnalis]|uniref:Cytochrome P450 n=3 Tax=Burkholderia TaxID=32008 RepID=A0ABX9YPJ7_9BURK|nr:cytochrome P450 [Burkholderia stagnalis]RQQ70332.1 cytochrome P450 [Burkholderia stagnalis]RQQ71368.1 cytochrome P450 [Burkholderia stagnalis]RQQ83491.1 cytochrome P450 [Burkholderia stagnalis]RQQ91506.1 cytochrome P450 [Burkholderia stagnalis]
MRMRAVEFDPRVFEHNDAAFIADPYPFYAYMRQHMRRYRADHLFGGAWLMFAYRDACELLRDPRLSASRARLPVAGLPEAARHEFEDMFSVFDDWIAFNEFHRHMQMRRQAHKAMGRLMPEQLRPAVRRIVDGLLRERNEQDRIDVVTELAAPLPALVLAELLGVPRADAIQLKSWSDDIARLYGSTNLPLDEMRRIRRSALALLSYLDDRAVHGTGGSVLDDLMAVEVDGYRPGRREAVAQAVMLLFAAIEPTAYLVGNAVAALQHFPDQLPLLHRNPDLVGALVEETLRYDTPVQFVGRLVREDFVWDSCRMREGQAVLCYVASAHRDSAHYRNPDRFDLMRGDARHLAFGHGTHYCLGDPAVRVIAGEALSAILRHFPSLTRDTNAPTVFNSNLGFRGRTSLTVVGAS